MTSKANKSSAASNPCRVILALLDMRVRDNERDLKEAVVAERWSHVAGLHGIGTGLLMAKRLVQGEFKASQVPAVKKAVPRAPGKTNKDAAS